MSNLSPTAQAVLDAMYEVNMDFGDENAKLAAAALRTAADQVVPDIDLHISVANDCLPRDIGAAKWSARYETRRELLAIATELEGPNG